MRISERVTMISTTLAIGVMSMTASTAMAEPELNREPQALWRRIKRVSAYEAPRRARYPSLARDDRAGTVICLFTHVTEEQEAAGLGELTMVRSTDAGETWSEPSTVYTAQTGEPRAMGTLTALASGRLVASIAETNSEGDAVLVRLLSSTDDAQTWQAGPPLELPGMAWACPYGRLVERSGGVLLMPVFGVRADAAESRVKCAALLRSTDAGDSWEWLAAIASEPSRSFTQPAVLATGEDSMLALVNSGDSLFRCLSSDAGRHWTPPEQVSVGREPQLTRISGRTLACVAAERPLRYGGIGISFSGDDAASWRCERRVLGYRHVYAKGPNREKAQWGWPAALALDKDHVLVAFGRTRQCGGFDDEPPPEVIPAESERIEIVFFERDSRAPIPALPEHIVAPGSRDRWEAAGSRRWNLPVAGYNGALCQTDSGELILVPGRQSMIRVSSRRAAFIEVGGAGGPTEILKSRDGGLTWPVRRPLNLPPGFRGTPSLLTQLSSGRLLCAVLETLLYEYDGNLVGVTGSEGGYARWRMDREGVIKTRVFVIYSDDNGDTWHGAERHIDIVPLDWAWIIGRFIEASDGTVAMTVYGCLSEKDTRSRLDCCGLFRSADAGVSWGDFSLVAYDGEQGRVAYNELDIAVMSDRRWIAFVRTEPRDERESSWMSRVVSTDAGRTWSRPELCFIHSVPKTVVLPDGGIVLGHSGGFRFSYDLGHTWTRVVPFGGYVVPMLMDDDTLLLGSWQGWGRFAVYRRVPAAGPGE